MRSKALRGALIAALLIGTAGAAVASGSGVSSGAGSAPDLLGAATTPHPLASAWLPNNPYMSSFGANSMHADAYASDSHPWAGPLGKGTTATVGYKGPCAGMTFTREGLILLQCGGVTNFTLRLVDPVTLKDLATYKLPPRPSTITAVENADVDKIYSDSSGAYFYIDNLDRVVVADADQQIQRIEHHSTGNGTWSFRRVDNWSLKTVLPHDCASLQNPRPSGECDPVTSVLPDWHGLMWWVTRHGRIGTLNPRTGAIKVLTIKGEEIENSHAVSEDGVSVVTDRALYQLDAGADGSPRVLWREPYDRGSARKVGQIDQGSGTTPTFIGKDWVAITDNADDRMHVLVYRRKASDKGNRLVCSVPVFDSGTSATENSLIGYDHSLVVENNYGYKEAVPVYGRTTIAGGLERIDINASGNGCRRVWASSEKSPSAVAKLSRGAGLVYCYTPGGPLPNLVESWYLTALDFRTGRTVFKVKIGTGPLYDNAFGPMTVGPKGVVYASIFGGVARVADS